MKATTPKPTYGTNAHKYMTRIAAELSGLEDLPVGKERTVKAPSEQRFDFSTKIHDGDTVFTILEEHAADPDLFAIPGAWQEQHGYIPATKTGLAPWEAQRFLNMALEQTDLDMRYLYLSWALHFLEDCGMPYHTTLDVTRQATHFAVEDYVDANISKFAPQLRSAVPVSISELFNPCKKLAESANAYVDPLYAAWTAGDKAAVDRLLAPILSVTESLAAGALQVIGARPNPQPFSAVQAVVIALPAAAVALAYTKSRGP